MTEKSREIWLRDYFTNIQFEFLSYYVRKLIYNREYDQKMFSDICKMKYDKIQHLAFRNGTASIFQKVGIWNKYVKDWMNGNYGLPNFTYRDNKQKRRLRYWDATHYFALNSSVYVEDQMCKIITNEVAGETLQIMYEGKMITVSYSDVKGRGYELLNLTEEDLTNLYT